MLILFPVGLKTLLWRSNLITFALVLIWEVANLSLLNHNSLTVLVLMA